MSNAITVMGLSVTRYPQSANPDFKRAEIDVLYTHQDVDSAKVQRVSIGRTSKEPFGKDPLKINAEYAEKLIKSKAFVSGKDYQVEIGFNAEDMSSEIIGLHPIEPAVKKHFEDSLKAFQG